LPGLLLFFNYSSSFRWCDSPLKFKDVADVGYQLINVSLGCLRASLRAVWDYLADLKDRGEEAEEEFERKLRGHLTEDFNAIAGFPGIREIESRFLPSAACERVMRNRRVCMADREAGSLEEVTIDGSKSC